VGIFIFICEFIKIVYDETFNSFLFSNFSIVRSQSFTEEFADITTLTSDSWSMQNLSSPIGTITNWFQPTGSIDVTVNTPFSSIEWSNSETSVSIENLEADIYTATVTADNGCTSVAPIEITEPTSALEAIYCHVKSLLTFPCPIGRWKVSTDLHSSVGQCSVI